MTNKGDHDHECCADCGEDHEGQELYVFPDEEGNEAEYILVETVEVAGNEYALFAPVPEDDEEEDDEDEGGSALILRVEKNEAGEAQGFTDLDSDEELEKVVAAFGKIFEDEQE